MAGSLVQSAALSQTMASSLLQPADFPTFYGNRAQLRRSTRTRAIMGVIMSKLQVHSRPLRISVSRVPHGFFPGNGSTLPNQTIRPVCKQARSVAVKAMFQHCTEKSLKVIMLAQEEARRLGHICVGTEHILLGLIGENTGIAAIVLKSMGINLRDARVEVEKVIGKGRGFVKVNIPFTIHANRVLEHSLEKARQLGHDYIGPEHLLLGLLRERGSASCVLEALGADCNNIGTLVIRMAAKSMQIAGAGVGGGISGQEMPSEEYGTNLTKLAEERKHNPVALRQFLRRSVFAEGLTERTANEDVPETIEEKKVITRDIRLLVAQTKHRGELEERLKKLMEEIKVKQSEDTIVFIDELRTLTGAGAEDATDAELLKVLFDEIEKAHPDVFNMMLKDGRSTDRKDRTVDLKNTVLIMTSNVSSNVIEKCGRRIR